MISPVYHCRVTTALICLSFGMFMGSFSLTVAIFWHAGIMISWWTPMLISLMVLVFFIGLTHIILDHLAASVSNDEADENDGMIVVPGQFIGEPF